MLDKVSSRRKQTPAFTTKFPFLFVRVHVTFHFRTIFPKNRKIGSLVVRSSEKIKNGESWEAANVIL